MRLLDDGPKKDNRLRFKFWRYIRLYRELIKFAMQWTEMIESTDGGYY